jgi:hypothetical protein
MMTKYIDKNGDLFAAAQWKGTKESADLIEKNFPVRVCELRSEFYLADRVTAGFMFDLKPNQYIVGRGEGRPRPFTERSFKKHFRPVSDARVNAILNFSRRMLIEAANKQEDGYKDDWREESFGVLCYLLAEESDELCYELENGIIILRDARTENAHAGLCLAFIHDKLDALELERIQNNTEEDKC